MSKNNFSGRRFWFGMFIIAIICAIFWQSPAPGQVSPENTFWMQAGDQIQVLGADQKQLGGEQKTYTVRRRLPDHWVEVETPEKQTAYLNLGQSLFITKISSKKEAAD